MMDISARELKGHNILAVERFWDNTRWMIALRASSIIGSGSGVSIIRFSSLRLICLSLGASFFSYATSSIGLARNTSRSTAM